MERALNSMSLFPVQVFSSHRSSLCCVPYSRCSLSLSLHNVSPRQSSLSLTTESLRGALQKFNLCNSHSQHFSPLAAVIEIDCAGVCASVCVNISQHLKLFGSQRQSNASKKKRKPKKSEKCAPKNERKVENGK